MSDKPSFQLKGGLVPLTILELYRYDHNSFVEEMAEKVEQAPDFFQQTPIVIALEKLDQDQYVDFIELSDVCVEFGMIPMAVRGGSEEMCTAADVAGLAKLPAQSEKRRATKTVAPETKEPDQPELEISEGFSRTSKVVRQPVRSGQQIYARNGDLIILAPVSAGAEVLADGNIHCYAPLRGRALAGVQGDTEAMIFCQSLEAELISIAGQYKVNEDLQEQYWKKALKISLNENQLILESLV